MKTLEEQARVRLLQRQSQLLKQRRERNRAQEAEAGFGSELRELEEISLALRKLDEGLYGLCEACGVAIGRQRLTAIPESRVCISCSEPAHVSLRA